MNLPETRQRKNLLYDFYENLLTHRQREIFAMHHMDDCSLAEIGATEGITPQAVADILKRSGTRLEYYDKRLGLIEKHENRKTDVRKIRLLLEDFENNPQTPEAPAIISQIRRHLENLLA
ncbi:MAG: DNA-binding protein [Defluviitaleaceae bacterium]|nr:DNA-binding protein [Defluviitaleaceae bacterium]